MAQIPTAIGLLVCEQVIVEEATKNVTPVNCFTRRVARHFPSEPFAFVAFVILNDGHGDVALEVAIRRLDTLDEIRRHSVRAQFENPLHDFRCLFRFRELSFPVAGGYQIEVYADNELIALRKIHIAQKEVEP